MKDREHNARKFFNQRPATYACDILGDLFALCRDGMKCQKLEVHDDFLFVTSNHFTLKECNPMILESTSQKIGGTCTLCTLSGTIPDMC